MSARAIHAVNCKAVAQMVSIVACRRHALADGIVNPTLRLSACAGLLRVSLSKAVINRGMQPAPAPLNSQLSILNSQLSILNSQLSLDY